MKNVKKLLLGLGAAVMFFGSATAFAANYTVVKEPWIDVVTKTERREGYKQGSDTGEYDMEYYVEPMPFVDGIATVYEDAYAVPGGYCCYGNYYTVDAHGNASESRSDIENSLWRDEDGFDNRVIYHPAGLYSELEKMGYAVEDFTPQKYTVDVGYRVSAYEKFAGTLQYSKQTCLTNGYAIVSKEKEEKEYYDYHHNEYLSEYAIIDRDENIVVPFSAFDYIAGYVSPEGLAWVEKDGKYGIIKVGGNDITVNVNGADVEFDVAPRIINSRTLVPLRAIFQALGATVDWDSTTQTVTSVKGDITVKMQIGSNTLYKNGNAATIDVAPQIIENRTLIPVRAIAEAFGNKVDWNSETKTVTIYN